MVVDNVNCFTCRVIVRIIQDLGRNQFDIQIFTMKFQDPGKWRS